MLAEIKVTVLIADAVKFTQEELVTQFLLAEEKANETKIRFHFQSPEIEKTVKQYLCRTTKDGNSKNTETSSMLELNPELANIVKKQIDSKKG